MLVPSSGWLPMRLPRLYAPGLSHLVQARFSESLSIRWSETIDSALFDQISQWLNEGARQEGVRIHAWSLTPEALLLVATPPHRQSLSRLIQAVGRRLGATHREGAVFQGRYRSALLEPAQWVMPAIVWVESAPVRLGIAPTAVAWRWSSAVVHTGMDRGILGQLSFHHDYWACGNTPFDRQAIHKALLSTGLSSLQYSEIENAIRGQWALGSAAFLTGLGAVASRRVVPSPRGRPKKVASQPMPDSIPDTDPSPIK